MESLSKSQASHIEIIVCTRLNADRTEYPPSALALFYDDFVIPNFVLTNVDVFGGV